VVVSVDADLQDDLDATPAMLRVREAGADIVYGVRVDLTADTAAKRISARLYYRLLRWLRVEVVFDHADFRLMTRRVIEALRQYDESNLFLRALIPQLGFDAEIVTYERAERFAGAFKYPLGKMLALARPGAAAGVRRPGAGNTRAARGADAYAPAAGLPEPPGAHVAAGGRGRACAAGPHLRRGLVGRIDLLAARLGRLVGG